MTTRSKTNMQLTNEMGTDFWNDSCCINELKDAVKQGACGATSNPVIVYNVIKSDPDIWLKEIDALISQCPERTEDEITWKLIESLGKTAAKILMPVFEKSKGEKGKLSLQINPKYYPNKEKMVKHAVQLAKIAPNIAVKVPVTEMGIAAMEEITANGISVTGTVSFAVAEAVCCAEAIERGLDKAEKNGINISKITPSVALMVGRLDDHLKRIMTRDRISIDPGYLEWAGIAVFKKTYKIFKNKKYRSKLLSAAYRNYMQWSELIGGDVILSMTYKWWNQFNRSDIKVKSRIDAPVDEKIINGLYSKFDDFKKSYDENGMQPLEFVYNGPTIHTLNQFISYYADLVEIVRSRMLT